MKAIQIFIFGNIYISMCAVIMVNYTCSIFDLDVSLNLFFFIFFATLCSYSFHWYLTPDVHSQSERYIWVSNNKALLLTLLIISYVCALIFFIPFRDHILALSVVSIFTFLYSATKIPFKPFVNLKKFFIAKTAYLAVVWTFVTSVLPVLISGKNWNTENTLFCLNRFLLIYPICILFDYRDKDEDKEQGIKNIVGILDLKGLKILYYVCISLFFISTIIFFQFNFSITQIMILLIPGIFLLFSFNYSIKTKSDYWYYFYLDGLMMLSGIFVIIQNLF